MASIVMGRASDPAIDQDSLLGMYRLRHTVFHERLQWDVNSRDGLEVDDYDDIQPIYMIARGSRGAVDGCWRLLPTEGPYMLKDTFPELLRGELAPRNRRIWELSRFAVAPLSADDRRQVNFSDVTFRMMQRLWDFAEANGVDSYVTVTSVALERMMRKIGLSFRRFGDGQSLKVGRIRSVACWIDVNEQGYEALFAAQDAAA